MPAVTGRSAAKPPRNADGFTPGYLCEVALQLRRHVARFAYTEAEVTAFLDRADEIQAEARALDGWRNARR